MAQPDISYSVHEFSQFIHVPHTTHMLAVKHIFRYLQVTLNHGLFLCPFAEATIIVGYCEADWAGYKGTFHSTTSYMVYFGPSVITCQSKKQLHYPNPQLKLNIVLMVILSLKWFGYASFCLMWASHLPPLLACIVIM